MTNVWRQGETAHAYVSLSETANGRTSVLTTGTYRTTVVEKTATRAFRTSWSASTGKADHCARSKRRYAPQGEASGGAGRRLGTPLDESP
jgi:hypothetical protein